MYTIVEAIIVLILSTVAIVFKQKNNDSLYAVFKPAATTMVIIISIITTLTTPSLYALIISLALFFALTGDLFLLKRKHFTKGLFSFLIAHVCFTIGFVMANKNGNYNYYILSALLFLFGIYFLILRKNLNHYKVPVALYFIVITIMTWQAISLIINHSNQPISYFIALASVLFAVSDGIIAFKKFKTDFIYSEVYILSFYWTAIFIFAISGSFINWQ